MSLINNNINTVKAFAPATSANMMVGFDILGFALESVGDYVTLTKRSDGQIIVDQIDAPYDLPKMSSKNTASLVLEKVCKDLGIACGFSLKIEKGIAIGSGMGGSAASAVASLVAFNAFLTDPLSNSELVHYALFGEELASGQKHADNIAPCVFGGVTLTRNLEPVEVINLPVPDIHCVIIHPHLVVETKSARKILKDTVPLKDYVKQTANLASMISALYTNDLNLLERSMVDVIIEPQRAQLVPGFYGIKELALKSGAIAASFSGSGPSMFAWTKTLDMAKVVAKEMESGFTNLGVASDALISSISKSGAYIVSSN